MASVGDGDAYCGAPEDALSAEGIHSGMAAAAGGDGPEATTVESMNDDAAGSAGSHVFLRVSGPENNGVGDDRAAPCQMPKSRRSFRIS